MASASESDFGEVIEELGPDELQHLFHLLGIKQRDIEHAEKSADTTDTRLKARAVLCYWIKSEGRDATREALFAARDKILNRVDPIKGMIDFFYLLIYFLQFLLDQRTIRVVNT